MTITKFDVFYTLSRKLPTQKILKLYLYNQRWVDLSVMYDYILVLFSASVNFDELFLYFSRIMAQQGPHSAAVLRKIHQEKAYRTREAAAKAVVTNVFGSPAEPSH